AGAKRKKLIDELRWGSPHLFEEYEEAKRQIDGVRHFASGSGVFPYCARGRVKTDSLFAEQSWSLVDPFGRVGVIVPTGVATDATTQYFFKNLVEKGAIAALYDFENRSGLFPEVDSPVKFCVLSLVGQGVRVAEAWF